MDTLGIIRQIESDPALRAQLRSVLLGDEMVELPALVRQLHHSMETLAEAQRATATTLAAFQESTDRRLGTLDTKVTTLDTKVTTLDTKVTTLDTKVTTLDTKVTTLDTKVTTLDTKVTALDTKVTTLDTKVTALDTKVTTLDTKVTALDTKVTTLDTKVTALDVDVASLKGKSLENRLTLRPRQYVPRQLARGARLADDDRIDSFLAQLDDTEAADVERADAVVEARQADGTPVVFVVEASWVAHADDVERADRRARALRQAGAPAVGLVVSHSDPAPPVLAGAARRGVAVVSESGGLLTNTTP